MAVPTKPLNILVLNTDWKDMFRSNFPMLKDKLNRDRLYPETNRFLFVSWSHVAYRAEHEGRYKTVHLKTWFKLFRPWYDLMSYFVIPRVVKKGGFRPDVVFVYDLGLIPAGKRVARMFGVPLVYCMTNMPTPYAQTRTFGIIKSAYPWILERTVLFWADFGYTLNQSMKAYLLELRFPESKIAIFVSDTIYRELPNIKQAKKGVIREGLGMAPDDRLLLAIGRLEAEKGYPRLLELFSALEDTYHLVILGEGSLKSVLESQAATLGIAKRVHFLGHKSRKEVWTYFLDSDAFILLSNVEALGLVFWEAMFVGTPVIGSTAPGIVESIGRTGDRGILIESLDTPEQFKEKVSLAVIPSEIRDGMIARAKAYVVSQFENSLDINSLVARGRTNA